MITFTGEVSVPIGDWGLGKRTIRNQSVTDRRIASGALQENRTFDFHSRIRPQIGSGFRLRLASLELTISHLDRLLQQRFS